MKQISFKRNELYELIWEKPLNNFISIYGGSYSDVKKMLAKNLIPLPPIGYWSRLRQGIEVSKTPLAQNPGLSETIIYSPKEKKIVTGSKASKKAKQHKLPKIPLDKLVVDAKAAYAEALKMSKDLQVISIRYNSLDIYVSKELLGRALNLFNHLIFEVKKQGGSVRLGSYVTYARIDGIEINVSVSEKTKRIKIMTDDHYGIYEKTPTGILVVRALIDSRNLKKEWADTADIKIEAKTKDIVQYLIQAAIEEKEQKRIQELERAKEMEERQIASRFYKRQESEVAKFLSFKGASERWETLKRMREYLVDLESTAIANNTLDETLRAYIDWAKEKIDWYDPMVNKSDELLDDVDKDTLELKKKSFW